MKPGRHKFLVCDRGNEYYLHRMLAPIRIDPIPVCIKETKTIEKVRVFEKDKSVFAKWVEDTPEMIKECIDHDK